MSIAPATLDLDRFNADVRAWGTGWRAALRAQVAGLNIRHSGTLQRTLSVRYRTQFNQVHSIGAVFPRYAVFVEKGARKGYGGQKGSRWAGRDGKPRKTDPRSLGKMNTGRSTAKRWFNPVTDRQVERLADVVVKHYGNAAINAIGIK